MKEEIHRECGWSTRPRTQRVGQREIDSTHQLWRTLAQPHHDLVARYRGQGLTVDDAVESQARLAAFKRALADDDLGGKLSVGPCACDRRDDHSGSPPVVRLAHGAAKGYAHGLTLGPVLFERPTLRVRTAAAVQLLAMKLSAWRDDVDVADARRLLKECRGGREQVWQQVERHVVPGRELKARYAFEDLWESEYGSA